MQKSTAIFSFDPEKMFIVRLSKLMPLLSPLLVQTLKSLLQLINVLRALMPSRMRNVELFPTLWVLKQIENVVQHRLKFGNTRIDLLQLLLNASTQEEIKVIFRFSLSSPFSSTFFS